MYLSGIDQRLLLQLQKDGEMDKVIKLAKLQCSNLWYRYHAFMHVKTNRTMSMAMKTLAVATIRSSYTKWYELYCAVFGQVFPFPDLIDFISSVYSKSKTCWKCGGVMFIYDADKLYTGSFLCDPCERRNMEAYLVKRNQSACVAIANTSHVDEFSLRNRICTDDDNEQIRYPGEKETSQLHWVVNNLFKIKE